MSYRMARLAARFAKGIGGGGTTTTEGKIPDELKPLLEGSVDRMLGLQEYFWGGGGGSGGGAYNPNTQGGNQTGGWGYNGNSLNQGAPPPTSGAQAKGGGAQPTPGGGAPAPAVGNDIYGVPVDPIYGLPTEIPSGGFVPPGETPWSQAGQESSTKSSSSNKGPFNQDQGGDGGGGGGGGGGGDYPWSDKGPSEGGGDGLPPTNGGGGGNAGGGGGYGLDIAGSHAREVAGASDLQRWGGNRVTDLYGKTEGEFRAADSMRRATNAAAQQVTGETINNDPAIAASVEAFKKFQAPVIGDRASLMGQGRGSAVLNNMDMGLASMMLPQIQAAQQREENRINRITGTALETGKGWQSLGAQDYQRRAGAIDKAMGVGGEMRSQAQQGMDAEYEDFLRRAALGENVLMGPFGGLVPSTIGSTTRSKK